jgi:2-methylcitrate dehydratase PrpD
VHRLVGRPDIPHPEANYAKLCLRFVAGTFLARGQVDVPDFRGRAVLDDAEVHRYAGLVQVILDDNPDLNALDPQTIKVRLTSGAEHSLTLTEVYGHPRAPLSEAENIAKFRRCAGYGARPLPKEKVEAMIATIADLQSLSDAARLVDLTLA